jgi:dihydroorotate dehydrogenase electron transfer subunit
MQCSVEARVVGCTSVCREHALMELALPAFPASDPGQFLQVLCHGSDHEGPALREWPADGFPSLAGRDLCGRQAFLRRPFSIADQWTTPDGTVRLCVLFRAVGAGTRWLERLGPGDTLNLTGPLGHGFRIPASPTPLVLVGGGVGLPALLYLSRRLRELRWSDATVVFGATTRDRLPVRLIGDPPADGSPAVCVELPGRANWPTIVTTDDGTAGLRGTVTDGLCRWRERRGRSDPAALVLACGPDAMLAAVAGLTRELGMECQLCIERNMGCGVGTCLSCVVKVRDAGRPAGWRWALACADGPVFARDELLDYGVSARA